MQSLEETVYDYIICGGGTAGCVLARRLASQTDASVLLVEAGRDAGVAPDVLIPGKYIFQLAQDSKGLWQLPTVPQPELNGRQIVFLRGRQLGGSSAVNYMALARGPAADYDEWAKLVGDESWKWDNILPLMKDLEDFRPRRPDGYEDYASPSEELHGKGGLLKIGFGDEMTPGVDTFFRACQEVGIAVCPDNNAGNPVGVGLAQFNNAGGIRWYAANAFLDETARKQLPNLTVLTETSTDGIEFQDTKAVGVNLYLHRLNQSVRVRCRQEIILSSGTFGSPQTLMLSGIGPKAHLESLGIPCVKDLPGVGQNVLDHSILTIEYRVDDKIPAHNQIFANPVLLAEADSQYEKDKTGPHNLYGTSGSVAFPKITSLFESQEFRNLDPSCQDFMREQSRPSAEIWLGSGPAAFEGPLTPEESYITHELLLQNNLSRGTISLRSANPRDLPLIDPKFLEHPYDRRIAIETVRQALKIGRAKSYQTEIQRMVHGPVGDDDESILDFVRSNLGQGYHSLGSCKMGVPDDVERVVDADFAVVGIEGLRVADLSVCPILTCNHTQINAYLIGEMCARRVIERHSSKRKDST